MISTSRRTFLRTSAVAAIASAMPRAPLSAQEAARTLRIDTRTIDVLGRPATVYGIFDETTGRPFRFASDRPFRVRVDNRIGEPTLLHWHGLTPPWQQDGVANLPHPPIEPGESHGFAFALVHPGTFWMHSHVGLQLQRFLAAPLIVTDPSDEARDRQEIVLMLQDFSFRPAEEILDALGTGAGDMHAGDADHTTGAMTHGEHAGHDMTDMAAMPVHANDIDHDAYLANERTLTDPEVVAVERGGRILLRIVNAAASTNFWVDTGNLTGTLVAVDGIDVAPAELRTIPLAMGQRIDLELHIPSDGGAFPVLARREGASERTGIVLATPNAAIGKIGMNSDAASPLLDLALESRLTTLMPLPPRPADRRLELALTGTHQPYRWAMELVDLSAHAAGEIAEGERVEIAMTNRSAMPHPMHLHGHSFQIVGVGNARLAGARRDTVQVPPGATVTIAFDADNPGRWAFHCHHLYHMAAGMMTTLDYRGSV